MCCAFSPDYRYDNSSSKPIGNVYCPNTMFSVLLCLHRKLFNLSAETTISILNAQSHVRCELFSGKNKHFDFSWIVTKGFIIFLERHHNHFKIILKKSTGQAGNVQDKIMSISLHAKRVMKPNTNVCYEKHAPTF